MSDTFTMNRDISSYDLKSLEKIRCELNQLLNKVDKKIERERDKINFSELEQTIEKDNYVIINPHPKYDEYKKKYHHYYLDFYVDKNWEYTEYQENELFNYISSKLPPQECIHKCISGGRYARFLMFYKTLNFGKGIVYSCEKDEIFYLIYNEKEMIFYTQYFEIPDFDKKIFNGKDKYIKYKNNLFAFQDIVTSARNILYYSEYMIPVDYE